MLTSMGIPVTMVLIIYKGIYAYGFRTFSWPRGRGCWVYYRDSWRCGELSGPLELCPSLTATQGVRSYMQQSRVYVGMILILIFGEVLGLYGYVYWKVRWQNANTR